MDGSKQCTPHRASVLMAKYNSSVLEETARPHTTIYGKLGGLMLPRWQE